MYIKKGANQKLYFHKKEGDSLLECSQPKGLKPKMRELKKWCKLVRVNKVKGLV